MAIEIGQQLRDERSRRGWTLRRVAERAGVSLGLVHDAELGRVLGLESYARLATALGLRPSLAGTRADARSPRTAGGEDLVHAAMGELEARACAWSAEVLHVMRLRRASFQALCPDTPDALEAWLRCDVPRAGVASTLVLLDPLVALGSRRRTIAPMAEPPLLRPRYRGYADLADALRRSE